MGILSNTVSISQFHVIGDLKDKDINGWISESLHNYAFKFIDETMDEESMGWVHLNDRKENCFSSYHDFCKDSYLTFSLRHDVVEYRWLFSKIGLRMRRESS